MSHFQRFKQVMNEPNDYGWQHKAQTGQKIIGYLCSYIPEEMIHAAGALPFRIFGHTETIVHADAHLQAYCCSIARTALEQLLSGKLDFLDGTVFPHTCDTMQRLSDIWRLNSRLPIHFDVVLPVKLNSASAFQYLVDILAQFKADLERGLGVEITEKKLEDSIRLYNQIRGALQELYQLRCQYPDLITGDEMDIILKAAMIMDRQEFFRDIVGFLDELKKQPLVITTNKVKRLMLVGGVCDQPGLHWAVEEAGGAVVWDDLCTGTRYFNGSIDEQAAPIEAIARRYVERAICPTKHLDINYRGEHLIEIVRDKNIHGVIFLMHKFCDPHAFDYPFLRQYLDRAGIPSLLLELEESQRVIGQLRTRLEAFVEMI